MQNIKTNTNFRITDLISSEIDFTNSERIKTGFNDFDSAIGGFRKSGTFLVAGAEKSGKSSFLLQSIIGFVNQGKKVAVFDTELESLQFYSRLTALDKSLPIREIENNQELIKEVQTKYYDKIIRFDHQVLSKNGMFDFNHTIEIARKAVDDLTCQVLIFDNVTTYQSQDQNSKSLVLPAVLSKIINLTKELKVWSFVVTHLKPDVKVSQLPGKIQDFIKSNEPEKIFSDSISVIRRPTTSDIYGGQQALSQLSGTLIVWRPYQNFGKSERIKKYCQIIATSFRDSSAKDCYFSFDEEKVRFCESSVTAMSNPINSYSYKEDYV